MRLVEGGGRERERDWWCVMCVVCLKFLLFLSQTRPQFHKSFATSSHGSTLHPSSADNLLKVSFVVYTSTKVCVVLQKTLDTYGCRNSSLY